MIYTLTRTDHDFAVRVARRRRHTQESAMVELGVLRMLNAPDLGPYLDDAEPVIRFPYWADYGVPAAKLAGAFAFQITAPVWILATRDEGSDPAVVRCRGWYFEDDEPPLKYRRIEDLRDMMKLGRLGRTWAEALAEVTNG